MKKKLVFLTGFMASGKSTIGQILANTIGWSFYDLDLIIEKREGKRIRQIFEVEGEAYFRDLETKILKELFDLNKSIIALGGGTIIHADNLKLIKDNGLLIYLESSPEETYKRLRFKRDRPMMLFNSSDEPTHDEYIARINELLNLRKKFYDQADIKFNTDNIKIGRSVDRLASIIKKELNLNETKS